MRGKDYIKDHRLEIAAAAGTLLAMEAVLGLFQSSGELMICILVLGILGTALGLWISWNRKKQFYRELQQRLSGLEEKYLLAEMLQEPEFLEGQMFYDTLRQVTKSMNDEIFSCQRKNDAFREYVETWVHEAKLPIAGMRLLLHGSRDKEARKLKEQVQRLEDCVEQVLYYLRSQVPQKDYRIRRCSLRRITDQAVSRHKDSLILNNIRILQETGEEEVLTDEKWLLFLLGQILSNAVKYRRQEDAQIRIFTESSGKAGDMVCLHIRDNGIGIPAEDLPRIFEKSFTGRNGRTLAYSTGMGLYLCHKLCQCLGHKLRAESKEGEYTDISIEFGQDAYVELTS